MNTDIQSFISFYASIFSEYGSSYSRKYGQNLSEEITRAVSRKKSTIYILGNGGSHAIARCFRHTILANNRLNNVQQRVVATVDPDNYSIIKRTPGPAFKELIQDDGADHNDLIILISGSGNSDNLVEVAIEAKEKHIPLIALVAQSKCLLAKEVPSNCIFPVGYSDQQIGEDILQFFSCLVGTDRVGYEKFPNEFSRQSDYISKIPSELILAMTESIERSFKLNKRVRILGLGNSAIAACAEHTAHNLNWDAFYQVNSEPDVNIISSPSLCDYSGISNDRRHGVLKHFSKIYSCDFDDSTTIIYSHSGIDPQLSELEIFDKNSKNVFLICGEQPPKQLKGNQFYCPYINNPFCFAAFVQNIGHILGRTLRLKLLKNNTTSSELCLSQAASTFLIQNDLAQRRLLD